MASQKYKNDPNKFCYICGKYLTKKQSIPITQNIKACYFEYFEIEIKISINHEFLTQLIGDVIKH